MTITVLSLPIRASLIVALVVTATAAVGCVSVPRVENPVYDSARATVALKVFPDSSFRANHPATIEPSLLTQVFHGIYVEEEKLMLETALTGDPIAVRAFTEEDIRLLTPHVADALAEATPEEEVILSLLYETGQGPEQTEASLYVSEGSLHVTLARYHLDPSRPALLSYPSPSFSRPKPWRLLFDPPEALLDDSAQARHTGNDSTSHTLIISFAGLTEHAERAGQDRARGGAAASPSADDQEKQKQIEELEEEVQQLRQSIREQDQKLERLEDQMNPEDQ